MGAYDRDRQKLNPRNVVRGKYGNIYDGDGNFMDNVTEFEGKIEFEKETIKRANAQLQGHRIVDAEGTGKMKIYVTNAEFIKRIAEDPDETFTLIGDLSDPDQNATNGCYKVAFKGVLFDGIGLMNFDVSSPIEQDVDFTFDDYEFI